MPVAQMFEECLDAVERPTIPANTRATGIGTNTGSSADISTVTSTDVGTGAVPVPEPLAGLLPGGLHRGEAAALATRNREQHADYLALALLAEALKAGLWCAVVGVPDLSLTALAGMLAPTPPHSPDPLPTSGHPAHPATPDPSSAASRAAQRQAAFDHLLLVPDPGERWAEALATLADGVDLLLVRPLTPVSTEIANQVDSHLRPNRAPETARGELAHGAALLVLGGWPSARLSLRVARADWTGLDGFGPTTGAGHLTGCRATVVAHGWSTAGRPRAARLWLPDANGSVRALSDNPSTTS